MIKLDKTRGILKREIFLAKTLIKSHIIDYTSGENSSSRTALAFYQYERLKGKYNKPSFKFNTDFPKSKQRPVRSEISSTCFPKFELSRRLEL